MTYEQNNLNQLPKGWTWTQLGEIAEVILGQSPPSSTYNDSGNGLPFYQGKLEFGKIYPTPKKWCVAPKKMAEKGDVLISVRAPVGPTNICPEKSCIGRGLAAIRGLGDIERFFILYLIRTFENVLAGKGTGTTFNAISGNQLKGLDIPLPPLPEQGRIVAKVEELFTNLDAGVESLKKVKTQLKRYRQAVLKYAFEGNLTEEWRKTHKNQTEPAQKLLEQIRQERKKNANVKYKEPPPIDTTGLPELPCDWVWASIDALFDVGSGGTPSRRKPEYWNGNIPWVSSGEVAFCAINNTNERITQEGLEKSSAKLYPPGTVLLALYGEGKTRGQAAILRISATTNQAVACILCSGSPVPSEYVYWWLYQRYFETRRIGEGANQPNVYLHHVRRMPIPLAPLMEQKEVVEKVEYSLSVNDKMEESVEQILRQGEQLRRSILKKAFEGKLVPQEPTDEPAEKLLIRIKEEKAKYETKNNMKNRLIEKGLLRYVK